MKSSVLSAACIVLLWPSPSGGRPPGRRSPEIPEESGILLGSADSLGKENRAADAAGLARFTSRKDIERGVASGDLVAIADAEAYVLDEELGEEDPDRAELYAHARPHVKTFLDDVLGEAFRTFGRRFRITSLARTEKYQRVLVRYNGAAARGRTKDTRSTHTTGSTVDISLDDLTWHEKQWVRKKLIELEKKGLVHATEERGTRCFHVLVLPAYDEHSRSLKESDVPTGKPLAP